MRHVPRIVLVAGLIQIVGLAANAVATWYGTEWGDPWRWFIPSAVSVVVSMVQAGVETVVDEPAAAGPQPGTARQRGMPVLLGFTIVIVVVGLLGLAVAAGVRVLVGYATGEEDILAHRLAQPTKARALGTLKASVSAVDETWHFTKVTVQITNTGDYPVSINDGSCSVTSDGGNLPVDVFRTKWDETKPPGITQTSTMTFNDQLPAGATRATVFCDFIFAMGAPPKDAEQYRKGLSLPVGLKARS